MRFKVKVKQVVKPYTTEEFMLDACNAKMAKSLFELQHSEYNRPEFHIVIGKCDPFKDLLKAATHDFFCSKK